jgi:hypothetical protein
MKRIGDFAASQATYRTSCRPKTALVASRLNLAPFWYASARLARAAGVSQSIGEKGLHIMKMPDGLNLSLKAAVADYDQLRGRAADLDGLGLPIRLELHTFGGRDVDDPKGFDRALEQIARLRSEFEVTSLVVHVPLQSVPVVTRLAFDTAQCSRCIAFAIAAGASAVVLHRYYALVYGAEPARIGSKAEAEAGFEEITRGLAEEAGDMPLRVENVGHYSLLPRDGRSFLTGPLDHFFPWEVARFRDFTAKAGLTSVKPFIDVAHATLSANLFNRARARRDEVRDDPRFVWITDEDLDQAQWLDPFDFVDVGMDYLHVSDAVQLDSASCASAGLDEAILTRSIVSEGLELGTGNLPFATLPARFGTTGTLVLEVDPAPGESHTGNGAQRRSAERLRAHFTADGSPQT